MDKNKRIAKNIIFLYFRMILITVLGLLTTRYVFKSLGVEDYGVYNLVASFIVIFSFLNNAMRGSVQRYLNVAISSQDKNNLNEVFTTSLKLHFLVGLFFVLLSETFGLWFLNNSLNIPESKIYNANIVYHISVLTGILNILCVPYQAIILAKEKMEVYSGISVLDAFIKLILVSLMFLESQSNNLIFYSIIILISSLIVNFSYFIYVNKSINLELIRPKKSKIKEMASFSSWNLFGQLSVICSNQAVAIIFNLFLGVKINASIAIANQVNVLFYTFVSNLQIAYHPQITQTFTQNDISRHVNLVLNASKYSMLLMLMLIIPLFIYMEFLLTFWLGKEIPEFAVGFSRVIMTITMIDCLSGPFWMSTHAMGKIKKYQIIISILNLLNIPGIYILLKMNVSPVFTYAFGVVSILLIYSYRFVFFIKNTSLNNQIIIQYLKNIIVALIFFIVVITYYFFDGEVFHVNSFYEFLVNCFLLTIMYLLYVCYFCISRNEFKSFKSLFLRKWG